MSESTEPARPAPGSPPNDASARRPRRRVVRQGAEQETVLGETADDRGGHDDNDDRLLRDVPPHWGRR
ncbi:transcriptional regulator [Krasilnikoviella flava]|uniref:Uncharacterized protein n=1 Tax=Krasilnikoviella flava TaxID=526729 RepID=A0A1T5IHF9_9MICO|nr:transcriptional regulator [Krasilnikoviella flava]SKC38510.1 hypothetical protein SAMN04324258_0515 [Krasilnikoviella flava]